MTFAEAITKFGFSEEETALIAPAMEAAEKSFPGGEELFFLQDEFIRQYAGVAEIKPEQLEEILQAKAILG